MPCSADASRHVTVLPLALSAHDDANRVQAVQHNFRVFATPAGHYLNATPSVLAAGHAPQDISVKGQSLSNICVLQQEMSSPTFLSPRSAGTISGTIRKWQGALQQNPTQG